MFLVVGATGMLGGRIATRLAERDQKVRALVRPGRDDTPLLAEGIDVVPGDLTRPETLAPALGGVGTVITTANAMRRMLSGDRSTTIAGVDRDGNAALIDAAEREGVERFVFVSAADLGDASLQHVPFPAAKVATEQRLARSPMRSLVVRPDPFQEVWLEPETGLDPAHGRALIYGHGRSLRTYVSVDDAAEACVRLALLVDPPLIVEFGGPDPMTRLQVVEAMEARLGHRLHRRHVPRAALVAGSRLLGSLRPELASVMGMALYFDRHDSTCTAEPLRDLGIEPRAASDYLDDVVLRAASGAGA